MKIFSSSARYFGLEVFNTACLSKKAKTKTDMSTKGMGQGLLGVLATLKITPKKPHYGILLSPKEVCFAPPFSTNISVVSCV